MTNPEVRRVPIIVGGHAIALLTLFKLPHDNLDDVWAWDWLQEEIHTQHYKSAKQFIDALEDHWSPAFLMALRDEITKRLEQHDKEYETDFANRTLKSYDDKYQTSIGEKT
jgi:hypothetical protein